MILCSAFSIQYSSFKSSHVHVITILKHFQVFWVRGNRKTTCIKRKNESNDKNEKGGSYENAKISHFEKRIGFRTADANSYYLSITYDLI